MTFCFLISVFWICFFIARQQSLKKFFQSYRKVICNFVVLFFVFFCQGFLSQTLSIYGTAGEGKGPLCSSLPLPFTHEHSETDDYHVFSIATLVNIRLLFNEIHHLLEGHLEVLASVLALTLALSILFVTNFKLPLELKATTMVIITWEFLCSTKFSFHHKWNEVISNKMVYTSCLTSCQTT